MERSHVEGKEGGMTYEEWREDAVVDMQMDSGYEICLFVWKEEDTVWLSQNESPWQKAEDRWIRKNTSLRLPESQE